MRLLLIAFLLPLYCFTQKTNEPKEYVRNIYSIDVGLMGPQVGFELQTGLNQSILLRAGLAPVYYSTSVDYGAGSFRMLTVSLNLSGEYRIYYNFQKRDADGKNIMNNSGNYFAFPIGFLSEPLADKYYFDNTGHIYFGALWGINRSLGKKMGFNFNLGPGYIRGLSNSAHGFTILGDVRVLFILN